MVHVIARDIVDGDSINVVIDDDIHLQGKIEGNSSVSLISRTGKITIDGKINRNSKVTLTARYNIRIGTRGEPDDRKIDDNSTVIATSKRGAIRLDGRINNNSYVTFSAMKNIRIGAFGDGGDRKIDDNSIVTLTSLRGSVWVDGKIDNNCKVEITAARDVEIGRYGDPGDRKIDNNSDVTVQAGGRIILGNKIDNNSVVVFRACAGIEIKNRIDGGARVRFATQHGAIHVRDMISNPNTRVLFWPNGSLIVDGGIQGGSVEAQDWAGIDWRCFSGEEITGSLIRDWGWTYGFITANRVIPRSLDELIKIIQNAPPQHRIKAMGGGWSFGDGALPFLTQHEVDRVSILKRGERGEHDFRRVLEGLYDFRRRPVDLQPYSFQRSYLIGRSYNQAELRENVQSGIDIPSSDERYVIIDTRGLASSLQTQIQNILRSDARERIEGGKQYFWVEAGITIANLNTLLDHQKPRLAIQASGGSPGATLAGTLATATHGGEFKWTLLVDMVRAIHLVGPGGEEWWIEGDESIADLEALQRLYPRIDSEHFIAGDWRGLDDLTAADVLNAVIVSLGAMGVVYSVVLEVVEQYGLEQRTVAIDSWEQLLALAGTTEKDLRYSDLDTSRQINNQILKFLLDGEKNGTSIPFEENVYVDLAINPINRACWIVNRRVTAHLPDDANPLPVDFDTYFSTAEQMLSRHAEANSVYYIPVIWSGLARRIHDFLYYGTSDADLHNNIEQIQRLLSFITSRSPILAMALATINVQAVLNTATRRAPNRGHQFLADLLDSALHALQGTGQGQVSTTTGTSYQVGAIGWPDDGIPGRAIEIALHPDVAFTYLQKVIFDLILDKIMTAANNPLIGYISIRICPQTRTFMGMQQFESYSVMIELVGLRTPEANVIMDAVQSETLRLNREEGLNAMLHWGLETAQMKADDLNYMPVTRPIVSNPGYRQIDVVREVRHMFLKNHAPVFDNNLVRRLEL